MRSAGNFHPQWGYLAPAPSFLRGARIVLVATAVGATAGAAVVVSLIERPGADVENSIAAHALVTSAPVVTAVPPVSPSAALATRAPTPIAAAPASKGLPAQAPAGAATPQPVQSPPASPKPVLANADAPATQPAPPAHAEAAADPKEAAPAKRSAGRRHRTASNERRWQGESGWRKRRWRDNGFAPLFRFRAFSSRGGSSGDYPN
jgi:hypothetical protein